MVYARALSGIAGSAVILAGTLAEAMAMLDQATPDLVLLDLRLPDGTGFDLLPRLARSELQPMVIVISGFLEDLSRYNQGVGRLQVMAKPVEPDELRRRVHEALRVERPKTPFTMPEYLQMACLGRHSLVLEVLVEGDVGTITIRDGEVWAASYSGQRAFAAFYAMACCEHCAILDVRPWPEGEQPTRQLAGSYQELLLEAARRQDERASPLASHLGGDELDFTDLLQSFPPLAVVELGTEIKVQLDAASAAELVAEGIRAVIAREYGKAVLLLERAQALDPENKSIRHRLLRLYELGHRADPALNP